MNNWLMYWLNRLQKCETRSITYATKESKGPRTKMLLVYVGATDSSDQPKIKYKDNKLQG